MARLPRLSVPGYPHHVIQRGNNRQAIFLDQADRQQMLDLLETLEGQFSRPRPAKTGGQGPKTRAFQRNMLRPGGDDIENALVK